MQSARSRRPNAYDVLFEGIVGVQKEAVLGARRSVVTVEEVVDDFGALHPNACVVPGWAITAIAEVPGGAHPSYAFGYYRRDNAYYKHWDAIARDRERFLEWTDEHILQASPESFRGTETIRPSRHALSTSRCSRCRAACGQRCRR